MHLEEWLEMCPNSRFLFTSDDHDRGTVNLKKNYYNKISKVVWNNEEFKAVFDCTGEDADKGLGAHSTRKHSADFADKAGVEVAQVEHRGRWIGEKKKSTCNRVYIRKDDPFTDAHVAALQCVGGPIKCELEEGTFVNDT